MAWVEFEGKRSKFGPPAVTISRAGVFVFNSACIRRFFNGYKYVKLFWNDDGKRIGIKPLSSMENSAYTISIPVRGGANFSSPAFLSHFGINYSETRSFPAKWNDKEGLLEFTVG